MMTSLMLGEQMAMGPIMRSNRNGSLFPIGAIL